jgi:hypothetical protein
MAPPIVTRNCNLGGDNAQAAYQDVVGGVQSLYRALRSIEKSMRKICVADLASDPDSRCKDCVERGSGDKSDVANSK